MPLTASLTATATIAIDRVCGTGPWPAASAVETAVAFHSTTMFAAKPFRGAAKAKQAVATRPRVAPPTRRTSRRGTVFIHPPRHALFGRWSVMSWDNSGIFVEVRFGPYCLHGPGEET